MKRLREKLAEIREITKGMRLGEKADYLWTYYKLPVLGFACGLFFVISFASTVITNVKSSPVLTVGVLNDLQLFYGEELDVLLKETFPDAGGYTAPEIRGLSSVAGDSNPYAAVQLAAYTAAGDMDALIVDRAVFDYLSGSKEALEASDISATELGQKAKELGIEPLYYIWYTDRENAGNAAAFKAALLRRQP